MRTLLISTTEPNKKLAAWLYIEGIANILKEFTETYFWFSVLNPCMESEKDFSFDFRRIALRRNNLLLKLESLLKNSYIVHAYHKEHLSSLKKVVLDFQPDAVIFTNLPAGCYIYDIKKIKPDVRTILIQHNVEYLVASEHVKYGKNFLQRLYYLVQKRSIKKLENKIMNTVDHIISISLSDKKIFQKEYGVNENKIHTIRPVFNYPKHIYEKNDNNYVMKNDKIISFVSSFDWYPNIKGAEFLVRKVFKNLIKEFPNLKLYLVGRNPVKNIYKLKDDFPESIVITGAVDNIYEYYKMSSCVVIPIFLGPGIKLKVLEAMASGVPTVMTSYVAKDYDLLDKGFCIADTPDEFVEHISKILTDSEFANELSKRQVQWYENYLVSEKKHAEEVIKTILFSDSKNEND